MEALFIIAHTVGGTVSEPYHASGYMLLITIYLFEWYGSETVPPVICKDVSSCEKSVFTKKRSLYAVLPRAMNVSFKRVYVRMLYVYSCFIFSLMASISLMASTYWAIPSATCLASRMASTTVEGRFTTSPPANTPLRVVMPYGVSRVMT